MSVWPSRQARPAVSVTTTPTLRPVRVADAGAQPRGRRRRGPRAAARRGRRSTLEASIPAAARVRPWRVRTIVVGPRRATTRAVSRGERVLAGRPRRTRPSALLTTLLVTTTTSPSARSATASSRADQVVAGVAPRARRRARGPSRSVIAGHQRRSRPRPSRRWRRASVIIRGTARHGEPGRPRPPATWPASTSSTSQPSSTPPSVRAP